MCGDVPFSALCCASGQRVSGARVSTWPGLPEPCEFDLADREVGTGDRGPSSMKTRARVHGAEDASLEMLVRIPMVG